LAVFAHLNGHGKYSEGLAEGQAAATGAWGVALDAAPSSTDTAGADDPPSAPYPQPGSEPLRSDAELEAIYKKAVQWDVGTARKEVDQYKRLLVAMGTPALKWMIAHHLSQADATEMLAFAAVIRQQGTEARLEISRSVVDPDDKAARAALRIVFELKAKEAGAFLARALRTPATQRTAAMAAGVIGSRESIPELIRLVGSKDRITARCALVSLGQLAGPEALATGLKYLSSAELPLRMAAVDLLAKLPQGFKAAQDLLTDKDERTARSGLQILSAIGSPEAVEIIGQALSDPRPGVKIQAMTSLRGRIPAKYKDAVAACSRDSNSLVQAVARRSVSEMQSAPSAP
jgi:HEAT repeat protein